MDTIIFLGYANTYEYAAFTSDVVGDNTLLCGTTVTNITINAFQYGQYNFQIRLICNSNLTWSINGSVLILTSEQISQRLCSSIDLQKFVITASQVSTFSDSQQQLLQSHLAALADIDPSRINVTQSPNDQLQNIDGQLIVTISNPTDINEDSSAQVLYNFSQTFNPNTNYLQNFLSNSSIDANGVTVNYLTYNETVGTTKGCYMKQSDGTLLTLLLGSNSPCTPTNTAPTPSNTASTSPNITNSQTLNPILQPPASQSLIPIIIAAVLAVFGSVILIMVIMMAIPGVRRAVFPKEKIRRTIKKRIESVENQSL